MSKMIIAGNGNVIPPELDAGIRDLIIGVQGHKLKFSAHPTSAGYLVSGIAFAYGYIALFDEEEVLIRGIGKIYVDFTVHHDEDIPDEVNIYFSDVDSSNNQDISKVAGTYSLQVWHNTLPNYDWFYDNVVEYPRYAKYADSAYVVTDEIASNATATTQATSDNTTKVATTEFVHNVIDAQIDDSRTVSVTNAKFTAQQNAINYRLGAVVVNLKLKVVYGQSVGGGTVSVGTVPFAPRTAIRDSVSISDGNYGKFDIDTSGNITLDLPSQGAWYDQEEFYINCGYLTS